MRHTQRFLNKRIIVTGGLGFLGRNLVEALLDEGAKKIIVVDDCSNSSDTIPPHWHDRVEHLRKSVNDESYFKEMNATDYVFHLACKTVLECDANPIEDLEVNAGSVIRILDYIRRITLSRRPKFLYTSSASVYGVTPQRAITEEATLAPCSQYGVSKLAGEKYTLMYSKTYGLRASALRLSNVYGPGQTPDNPYCGVVGIFINQAECGLPLTIIGDGSQVRDYTYVDDAIEMMMLCMINDATDGEVYNVSNGRAVTINDLAEEIRASYPGATTTYLPNRIIDNITYRLLNSSKGSLALGWRPKTDLRTGIRNTIEWHKNHN